MSNYYNYREIKATIAEILMNIEGWKVYGYSPDNSDIMTDYWDPAHWGGVAEKNGYILCVDVYGASKGEEIRKYNTDAFTYDKSIQDKIVKLEAMTTERGATEAEEASAKKMIAKLQKKAEESTENKNKYVITGYIPAHMAHPTKCNWHIEKDNTIIAKGNGILKFLRACKFFSCGKLTDDMKNFRTETKENYIKNLTNDYICEGYYTRDKAKERAECTYNDMIKYDEIVKKFEQFINKIDTTCGGLLGSGDGYIYETVKETIYKKENKVVETVNGSVKDGQYFILKSNFNYGCHKGLVYRIHETESNGVKCYHAYKMNGKLTKECTGNASRNNYWFIGSSNGLEKWIAGGSIAWCDIQEVKTPYEVEKVVKKKISNNTTVSKARTGNKTESTQDSTVNTENTSELTYTVSEDTDTRDNSKIYLVKVEQKLTKEEYIKVNKYIKSLGGYYSRFKHAFLFKEDPSEKLGINQGMENKTTEATENICTESEAMEDTKTDCKESEQAKQKIDFSITEDEHTKTHEKLWLVNINTPLDRSQFADIKHKLATLKGFYSSFKKAFIFKYNPEEELLKVV